jgi:hypothetical protein
MRSPNCLSGDGQCNAERPGERYRQADGYLSKVHGCANFGAGIDNNFSIW